MAYTKKEFAAMTGMTTGNLSNYIRRKKVVVDGSDLIDMTEPKNVAFLEIYSQKAEIKEIKGKNKKKKAAPIKKEIATKPDEKAKPKPIDNTILEFEELKTDIKKLEKKELEIKIAKMEGGLLPIEPLKSLILNYSRTMVIQFRQALEKNIDLLVIKYKLSGADAAMMRRNVVESINEAVEKAVNECKAGIKSITAEYSEKK